MHPIWLLVIAWIAFVSVVGFLLMGYDKSKAVNGGRRVRERTFFRAAAMGGFLGVIVGMWAFNHKTTKLRFTMAVGLSAATWLLLLYGLYALTGPP